MFEKEDLIKQLDALFHPQSIAVVGVPRDEMKIGRLFLTSLLDQGFPGRIYPVNPETSEIEGFKTYPCIEDIPGTVDLAIVLVPHEQTPSVIRGCASKGVKGVVLFTAGYRETGGEQGRVREEDLVGIARNSGMRIIGPNGMGLYCPKSGLSFFPQLPRRPGHVGIISHSGSLTAILGRLAPQKGIHFSKIVSLGNECDLCFADFLLYLAADPETNVIGGYLEGIKDGPVFLDALRKASMKKPVILWKVGLTQEGARAAAAHTGALAGDRNIWNGVVRQGGAIPAGGFEAWVDALMGFSLLPSGLGDRMAILSGPGGLAVSAAETCGDVGLRLAELSRETISRLIKVVPPTGTSLRNPIDVGLTAFLEIEIYIQAARALAADPGVDTVVVIGIGATPEINEHFTVSMVGAHKEFKKPFIMVNIPGFDPGLARRFCESGIPFFDSAERAMHTYSLVRQYYL